MRPSPLPSLSFRRRRPVSEVVTAVRPSAHASPMAEVRDLAAIVATSSISVLLMGPPGAGKEVLAAAIHAASPRGDRPLVKLDCVALPEHVMESQLFGEARGAFNGGTVFLDEVAELPLSIQAKLLRALDAKEASRTDLTSARPLDVRFIAATSRDLSVAIEEGRFREDLYYRLNGMTLVIPALRDRADEILPLAETFAGEACAALGQPAKTFEPAAIAALHHHDWPGNVRELRSVIERACVLCPGGRIGLEHVAIESSRAIVPPADETPLPPPPRIPRDLGGEKNERARILNALEEVAGNQSRAARLLGISRSTLLRRLDDLDLPRPRKSS